jgi:hypothetical protein
MAMKTTRSLWLFPILLASLSFSACGGSLGDRQVDSSGDTMDGSPQDASSACVVDGGVGSGAPIKSATYDFAHIHTMANYGDTWDVAWADDGNLYSTYDDGAGFSHTRSNFGIAQLTGIAPLTGSVFDVSGLVGNVDNSMTSQFGPMCGYPWWKTGGLVSVDGALYLFASPDGTEEATRRQTGGAVSLVKSTDHGATWSTPPRQYADDATSNFNFQDGTLKKWTVALGSGGSTSVGSRSATICSSVQAGNYAILGGQGTHITKMLTGLAPSTHYRLMTRAWADSGSTVRVEVTAGGTFDIHGDTMRTSAGFMDSLNLDFTTGSGAQSVSIDVSNLAGSATGKVYAGFFRLLPSTFPGASFGAPSFVKYGKDYNATVDGADKYVYAVSNNGYFANGDYLILGRVLRSAIGNLKDSDWQFYRGCIGADGTDDANWTSSITDPSVTKLLDNPGNVGMVDVTYIGALQRYIMLDWGWRQRNSGKFERSGTTTLDTYEAPYPWGPWTKVGTVQSLDPEAFYDPHIITKFVKVDPANPKKAYALIATAGEWDTSIAPTQPYYKLTLVPMTISTE